MRRCAYLLESALGLLLLGCGVPEYRINLQNIPPGTASLQVATYLQGAISTDLPTIAVTGPLDNYTFGLDLPGVTHNEATVSVAARSADNCLLAVGTQDKVPYVEAVSNLDLKLEVPILALSTEDCPPALPVIMTVIRKQQGPLQNMDYFLILHGWGFQPTATVTIRSTAHVQCGTNPACMAACPTACPDLGGSSCRTECMVTVAAGDLTHRGPGLLEVSLKALNNVLVSVAGTDGQSVGLLQLLMQPLAITVTNPDQSTSLFQETGFSPPGR